MATGGLEKVWHLIGPIQAVTSADPSEVGQEEV